MNSRLMIASMILLGSQIHGHSQELIPAGKPVTMIIGTSAGGGTDSVGRLIAAHLARHPSFNRPILIQNIPGADGIVAMNYVASQAPIDGSLVVMSATPVGDPLNYRKPQAKYDPIDFRIIGGIGRGGSTFLIRNDAESRLEDKRAEPVVIGGVAGVPRSGAQGLAWGIDILGWNARWAVGYKGTNELFLALQRGEIDMMATGSARQIEEVRRGNTGIKILSQTGLLSNGKVVARSEFADVPVFADVVEAHFGDDPRQKGGFTYWNTLMPLDKWLSLPPKTPEAITSYYRGLFLALASSPAFKEAGERLSEDFETQSYGDVEHLLIRLGKTSEETFDYIRLMLDRQKLTK